MLSRELEALCQMLDCGCVRGMQELQNVNMKSVQKINRILCMGLICLSCMKMNVVMLIKRTKMCLRKLLGSKKIFVFLSLPELKHAGLISIGRNYSGKQASSHLEEFMQ